MKAEMKQNKDSSVIRFSSATLAFFVLFFSLCVPSFAYTDNSVNGVDFTNQPYTNTDYYNSTHYLVWGYNSSNGEQRLYFSSSDEYYVFGYPNSASSYRLAVVALSSVTSAGSSRASNNGYSGFSVTTHDTDNDLYYNGAIPFFYDVASISSDIPVFSSVSVGLSAVRSWIDDAAGTPHPLSFSVPAGNAVYIDVTGVSTVQASFSMSTEVAHPQSWVTNQYYGWASSYPSSIVGNPTGSTPIPWSGYGDKTIFNRYKSFSWSLTSVGSSNYLFICNPYASIDEYDQSFNPTIYVHLNEAVGYKYYQLTGGIGSDGTIGQQSDGTTASGSYNDSTESWETTNDQTGQPWTPSEGGGNLITTNSINDWLKTIATQISNFFAGAIGAVTTLVGAGSDFIQSLSGLYSWLPSPVYAVLSSALILVITIGVIKVFI